MVDSFTAALRTEVTSNGTYGKLAIAGVAAMRRVTLAPLPPLMFHQRRSEGVGCSFSCVCIEPSRRKT